MPTGTINSLHNQTFRSIHETPTPYTPIHHPCDEIESGSEIND